MKVPLEFLAVALIRGIQLNMEFWKLRIVKLAHNIDSASNICLQFTNVIMRLLECCKIDMSVQFFKKRWTRSRQKWFVFLQYRIQLTLFGAVDF